MRPTRQQFEASIGSDEAFCPAGRGGAVTRDKLRAECALSAPHLTKNKKPKRQAKKLLHAELGGWDGQYFSHNLCSLALGGLEQSNDTGVVALIFYK